jgi:hypothetical protein
MTKADLSRTLLLIMSAGVSPRSTVFRPSLARSLVILAAWCLLRADVFAADAAPRRPFRVLRLVAAPLARGLAGGRIAP